MRLTGPQSAASKGTVKLFFAESSSLKANNSIWFYFFIHDVEAIAVRAVFVVGSGRGQYRRGLYSIGMPEPGPQGQPVVSFRAG